MIMVKNRGLETANKKLANIEKHISMLLKTRRKVKVFESGCGHGLVMAQLKDRFGNRIDISGMNLKPLHGTKRQMITLARQNGVRCNLDSIKILYGDAAEKIPLKTSSIDLLYSQVSSYLYKDKLNFYKEAGRVLKKGAVARITPHWNHKISIDLQDLMLIYKGGEKVSFEYLIRNMRAIKIRRLKDAKFIEIAGGKLEFGVSLKYCLNVNSLNKEWWGQYSIYSDVKD